jgi:hypothetical protein
MNKVNLDKDSPPTPLDVFFVALSDIEGANKTQTRTLVIQPRRRAAALLHTILSNTCFAWTGSHIMESGTLLVAHQLQHLEGNKANQV